VAEQEEKAGVSIPVEWHFPEQIASRYATNLVVQSTQHEFIISFFEVRHPILIGSPEEQRAQLEQIKSIRAECVARIIVAAEKMPEFLQVLQVRLDAFQARREKMPPQSDKEE
jgi:Protein of unknown function (DUF3467)